MGRQIAAISSGLQSLQCHNDSSYVRNWTSERITSKMVSIKTTQRGLHDGWTRATFILRERHLEELKALAYWERKTIKEVMDEALGSYLRGKRIKSKKSGWLRFYI
jgi:hypothetical protein